MAAHKHVFKYEGVIYSDYYKEDVLWFQCQGCNRSYQIIRSSWRKLLTGEMSVTWA